jgi:hypothetical protein
MATSDTVPRPGESPVLLFAALLAASCNVPARPGTCDTPTTLTLGDEAMLSIRVTPACCRAALVVAIVGITYKQYNNVYSITILNTVKYQISVPVISENAFFV